MTITRPDHGSDLDRAASLLDAVARTTTNTQVLVRCLLAAELLAKAGATSIELDVANATERELLRQALRLLAHSDEPSLDDVVLEATHHALFAHAATR